MKHQVKIETIDGIGRWFPKEYQSTSAYTVKIRKIIDDDEEVDEYLIEPEERIGVTIGFCIPDSHSGFEAQIRTLPELAYENGFIVLGSPHTVKKNKDEIRISIFNSGDFDINLRAGMEIALLVLVNIPHIKLSSN